MAVKISELTATSARNSEHEAQILNQRIAWFFERYAPKDQRESSEFHADFLSVVHQIYRAANAPVVDQMCAMYAAVAPITPTILKDPPNGRS